MNTDLEVIPLKVRLRHSGLVTALLAVTALPALAQQTVKTGDRVMVPTLQSSEKDLGVQAAEAIRNQLTKQTNVRDLVVVPKADINNSLASSGYSTTEALAPGDAKALATLVRAPQYLEGTVTRTPTGFRIDSRLIISRDMARGQALPPAQGGKLDDAASQVARAIKDARRQIPGETTCHNAVSQQQFQAGVTAARAAMAGYPSANIAAACLVDAYAGLKMDDSVITISERIRATDPRNIVALRRLITTYRGRIDGPQAAADPARAKADTTKLLEALGALAASDPTNIKQVQDVVNEYASLGHASDAIPLVRDLLQNNPGDPQLLNLAWLVYLNAQDYQGAVNIGTEMVRVDTAAASANYYTRLVAAYTALNQPQKASEAAARGQAKFPNDPQLSLIGANSLYKAGQLQQALDAARKAVAANPKNPQGYFLLATIQGALNQYDDVVNTLNQARLNGADATALSQIALQQGSNAYKAGQGSKDRADFQRAIKFLQLSDQLQASVDAKFLLGASAFSLGQSATIDANERRSCELARMAREAFNIASINLPAGGQKYPNEAAQLLAAIPQFTPAVDNEIKRFCK
ncbi:MAG: tetratricopeptide repeat protein [Burkholderiaceae bacterium]|nr:tetratricopeptide repeat protein [Burkholderiaceae bacterium]